MRDRHGNLVTEEQARALLRRERPGTPRKRRADPAPQGYVAAPGSGPEGQTCGSCRHVSRQASGSPSGRSWAKCGLMRGIWTGGRKTDVLARSPACSRWEATP